jgi:FKBP-type peptidyl-prolyl cis-trans isomerase FklB
MSRTVIFLFSIISLCSVSWAAEQLTINNQQDKDSYSLGYTFGKNLKKQGVDLNTDMLLQAVRDGLEQKQPALSMDEIRETVYRLEEKMRISQEKRAKESASKNLEEGKAFLERNKKKEGVKTLPDGLQYKVLVEGNGPTPKSTDFVSVNYKGSLIDGTLFDSSYTRGKPANLRVDGVIKGWTEALQLMKPGSKWEIFVPPDLAYGKRNFGRIPPNSVLIFELELLSIERVAGHEEATEPENVPAVEPPANEGGRSQAGE